MTPSELFAFVEDFLNFKLFTVQNTPITLSSLFVLGILLFLVSLASRLMRDVVVKRLVNKFQIDEGTRYTLARLSQYTMLVLGSVFSFQFVGIDLSGFTVIFGLLSVGIGFGLQNITSNFISGLIVLFERPITVGDRVIINDLEGDVREINIRSTRIQTLNNVSVIVPNSQFVEGTVINMSHGESKLRIIVDVGVSYDSDLDTVMKALKEVAEEHPKVLKHPEPLVLFLNFGDSSWDMSLRCWIQDAKEHIKIKSELNCAIVHKFRAYNIEIPFPQRDLHLRTSQVNLNSTNEV